MKECYAAYKRLQFRCPVPRVLEITLLGDGKSNALDATAHGELARIWRDVDDDIDISCVVVRGRDAAFAAGGHLDVVEALGKDFDYMLRSWKEARDIVYNIMNCGKPIISAIRGPAAGAGLAVALMADISVVSRTATIADAHTKIGLPAGDHAVVIWPLLCGMAKAKSRVITADAAQSKCPACCRAAACVPAPGASRAWDRDRDRTRCLVDAAGASFSARPRQYLCHR